MSQKGSERAVQLGVGRSGESEQHDDVGSESGRESSGRAALGGMFDMPRVGIGRGVLRDIGVEPPGPGVTAGVLPVTGVTRQASESGRTIGKGMVPRDARKFKYDTVRARTLPALEFGASKVDRLDADVAGDMLDRIHKVYGIDREGEDVLQAFDRALFFEHTINGASLLQPGRGSLRVQGCEFEIELIKKLLGVDQRRFFRAYADNIASVNQLVLDAYDPYDPVATEKYSQVMQVAVSRGLHKFPHLAHDSSDAGNLTLEERFALATSKRVVIPTVVNNVDKVADRVSVGDAT